jgi:hypothetical protein
MVAAVPGLAWSDDLMDSDRRSSSLFWRAFCPMTSSHLSERAMDHGAAATVAAMIVTGPIRPEGRRGALGR